MATGGSMQIVDDLPPAGQHRARTVAVGPDRQFDVAASSAGSAREEPDDKNATVMRARLAGTVLTAIERRLRYTECFG